MAKYYEDIDEFLRTNNVKIPGQDKPHSMKWIIDTTDRMEWTEVMIEEKPFLLYIMQNTTGKNCTDGEKTAETIEKWWNGMSTKPHGLAIIGKPGKLTAYLIAIAEKDESEDTKDIIEEEISKAMDRESIKYVRDAIRNSRKTKKAYENRIAELSNALSNANNICYSLLTDEMQNHTVLALDKNMTESIEQLLNQEITKQKHDILQLTTFLCDFGKNSPTVEKAIEDIRTAWTKLKPLKKLRSDIENQKTAMVKWKAELEKARQELFQPNPAE